MWARLYLVERRGADLGEGIAGFSIFEIAGWDVTFMIMLVCVALAISFFALVGKEEKRLMAEQRAASALS